MIDTFWIETNLNLKKFKDFTINGDQLSDRILNKEIFVELFYDNNETTPYLYNGRYLITILRNCCAIVIDYNIEKNILYVKLRCLNIFQGNLFKQIYNQLTEKHLKMICNVRGFVNINKKHINICNFNIKDGESILFKSGMYSCKNCGSDSIKFNTYNNHTKVLYHKLQCMECHIIENIQSLYRSLYFIIRKGYSNKFKYNWMYNG